jgi:hypothetical protein
MLSELCLHSRSKILCGSWRYLIVCFIFTLIFQFKNWKNKFVKLFNVIAVMGNGTQEEDATEKQNQSLTKIIYPSTLRKWEL